jgi:hypothetical protein
MTPLSVFLRWFFVTLGSALILFFGIMTTTVQKTDLMTVIFIISSVSFTIGNIATLLAFLGIYGKRPSYYIEDDVPYIITYLSSLLKYTGEVLYRIYSKMMAIIERIEGVMYFTIHYMTDFGFWALHKIFRFTVYLIGFSPASAAIYGSILIYDVRVNDSWFEDIPVSHRIFGRAAGPPGQSRYVDVEEVRFSSVPGQFSPHQGVVAKYRAEATNRAQWSKIVAGWLSPSVEWKIPIKNSQRFASSCGCPVTPSQHLARHRKSPQKFTLTTVPNHDHNISYYNLNPPSDNNDASVFQNNDQNIKSVSSVIRPQNYAYPYHQYHYQYNNQSLMPMQGVSMPIENLAPHF